MNTDAAGADIGVSGGFYSTLIWIVLGGFAAGMIFSVTQNMILTMMGFVSIAAIGIYTGGPTISVIAVYAVIVSLLAGWFILKKVQT